MLFVASPRLSDNWGRYTYLMIKPYAIINQKQWYQKMCKIYNISRQILNTWLKWCQLSLKVQIFTIFTVTFDYVPSPYLHFAQLPAHLPSRFPVLSCTSFEVSSQGPFILNIAEVVGAQSEINLQNAEGKLEGSCRREWARSQPQ